MYTTSYRVWAIRKQNKSTPLLTCMSSSIQEDKFRIPSIEMARDEMKMVEMRNFLTFITLALFYDCQSSIFKLQIFCFSFLEVMPKEK